MDEIYTICKKIKNKLYIFARNDNQDYIFSYDFNKEFKLNDFSKLNNK